MKTTMKILVTAVYLAAFASLAACSSGCTAMSAARENIDAAAVIETVATAAAAAGSGDYSKGLAAISKIIQKRKAASDPLAGFAFTRTYFVDDVPTAADRIRWRDEWSKTGSADKQGIQEAAETGTATTAAPDDPLVNEIADALLNLGLAE